MIRFIIHSYIFPRILIITILTILCVFLLSKVFDYFWKNDCAIPLENMGDVYNPPKEYDNITKVRLRLINTSTLFIEGNKKFKILNSPKDYNYYDTFPLTHPGIEAESVNRIAFRFINSTQIDSILVTISKSLTNNIYWNQIFYSSVFISSLNKSSDDSTEFRNYEAKLVSSKYLDNNDSLIHQVYSYYNNGKDSLKFGDCLQNSITFKSICDKLNLPCRVIGLMGGDATDFGWDSLIGYPSHALCEIYSSRQKKWIVVDPSFGFTYRKDSTNLSAAEICNKVFFMTEKEIKQDSVLFTKSSNVGNDYYKYFENVYFRSNYFPNTVLEKILRHFFTKFNYDAYHYSNSYLFTKNGYYYIGIKLMMFGLIIIININVVFFILLKRLYKTRRMKPKLKQITNE